MSRFHRVARLCLVLGVAAVLTVALASHAVVVTLVSDIHYDPLYGTDKAYRCTSPDSDPLGQINCDSSKALMESTFADISSRKNAYVLYPGDWQRHAFKASGLTPDDIWPLQSDGIAGIETSGELDTPGQVSVVTCLGNNDMTPHNGFDWSSTEQPDLAARIDILTNKTIVTAAEAEQMARCSFYSRNVSSTLRVVSLLSMVWVTSLKNAMPDTEEDPCGQFVFLESELAAAKSADQKVIIITHYPTTVDFYVVTSAGAFTSEERDMLWKPRFQKHYYQLVAQYADTVTMQFFGHVHHFTPIAHLEAGVPAAIVPGICMRNGNIASYLEVSFSDDWTVSAMSQRYLASGTWHTGLEANVALGFTAGLANVTQLREDAMNLLTNDDAWENYLYLHGGGERRMEMFPNGECNSFCRAVTVCSMTNAYYDDIKSCVADATAAPTTEPPTKPTTEPTTEPPTGPSTAPSDASSAPLGAQLAGSVVTCALVLGVSVAAALV